MVYNVFTMGVDKMGEYDVALKRMHRYDSIKKEIDGYQSLLSKLVIPEDDIPSDYLTHEVTGVVYDLRILKRNIDRLHKELDDLEE